MDPALIQQTCLLALATTGATALLGRRAAGGAPANDATASLLRLSQALPVPFGFLYLEWWTGALAVPIGLALGAAVQMLLPRQALPIGIAALALGILFMARLALGPLLGFPAR